MRERGTVVCVTGDMVHVAIEPSAACEACGGCAEGVGGKRLLEGALNDQGAGVGDTVEVETPLRARRRAQGLIYVVPVTAIGGGYLAGFLLGTWAKFAPDALGAVIGIGAGALALVSLRRFDRRFEVAGEAPRVRAIIARCRGGDSGFRNGC